MFEHPKMYYKYRSGLTAQVRSMGFMRARHKHVFGLASMVNRDHASHDMHAHASTHVYSRF